MRNGEDPLDEPPPTTQSWVEMSFDPERIRPCDRHTEATEPRRACSRGRTRRWFGAPANDATDDQRCADAEQENAGDAEPDRDRNQILESAAEFDVGVDIRGAVGVHDDDRPVARLEFPCHRLRGRA